MLEGFITIILKISLDSSDKTDLRVKTFPFKLLKREFEMLSMTGSFKRGSKLLNNPQKNGKHRWWKRKNGKRYWTISKMNNKPWTILAPD